jgi:mannose-1-phosphate guanylyltransferase
LTTNARGVSTPKQYCSLNGGPSLLQLSLRRALAVTSRERIVTVVNEAHRRWWEAEFATWRGSTVVVQPCNQGTGLGVLLPLLVIAKSDPDAGVLCIPSDHCVEHEDLLAEFLRQATAPEVLDSDKLTLLGMVPTAPDSSFGYLVPVADSAVGMRPVLRFVEKPDASKAAELIRTGSVWSSGIVAGRISQIVGLYPREVPGLMLDLKAIVEYWADLRNPGAELGRLYSRHPKVDFSRDVLQRHPEHLQFLTVIPCGWSDVGTPERLANTLWSLRVPEGHSVTTGALSLAGAFAIKGGAHAAHHEK